MHSPSNKELLERRWNEIYGSGLQLNLYPYEQVIRFLNRHFPDPIQRSSTSVLDVGCGAGNNLWFAARHGFQCTGIDIGEAAIAFARERFRQEDLSGEFVLGSFAQLPFCDASFDAVLDRCAITAATPEVGEQAIAEIYRCLKPGGVFMFNTLASDQRTEKTGHAYGVGTLYDEAAIRTLFPGHQWQILSWHKMQTISMLDPSYIASQWLLEAQRI